jgi:hypothetical protein
MSDEQKSNPEAASASLHRALEPAEQSSELHAWSATAVAAAPHEVADVPSSSSSVTYPSEVKLESALSQPAVVQASAHTVPATSASTPAVSSMSFQQLAQADPLAATTTSTIARSSVGDADGIAAASSAAEAHNHQLAHMRARQVRLRRKPPSLETFSGLPYHTADLRCSSCCTTATEIDLERASSDSPARVSMRSQRRDQEQFSLNSFEFTEAALVPTQS